MPMRTPVRRASFGSQPASRIASAATRSINDCWGSISPAPWAGSGTGRPGTPGIRDDGPEESRPDPGSNPRLATPLVTPPGPASTQPAPICPPRRWELHDETLRLPGTRLGRGIRLPVSPGRTRAAPFLDQHMGVDASEAEAADGGPTGLAGARDGQGSGRVRMRNGLCSNPRSGAGRSKFAVGGNTPCFRASRTLSNPAAPAAVSA